MVNETSVGRALRREAQRPVVGVTWIPGDVANRVARDPEDLASSGVDFLVLDEGNPEAEALTASLRSRGIGALWTVSGPFTRAAQRVGWGEAIARSVRFDGDFEVMLDHDTGSALATIASAARAGAAGMVVAEDLFGSAGPLIPPDVAIDSVLPRCAVLAATARGFSLPSIFHTDGDARVLWPTVARSGFDAVHLAWRAGRNLLPAIEAAFEMGLVPVGGIEVGDSDSHSPESLVVAARDHGLVITDTGGIASAEEFESVLDRIGDIQGILEA